ncbi:MAG: nucleoside kinase [Bacilli bacterium]|nr:nucleoside kinase [Bacilli bacterium]
MLLDRYNLKVYQAGIKFILYVAVKKVLNSEVSFSHSLDKGLYTEILINRKITESDINNIKLEMDKIISDDLKITKKVIAKNDAYNFYMKNKEFEKAGNICNLNNKVVTLYELAGYHNYFMSNMPSSTGKLKQYKITFLGNNALILSVPIEDDGNIPDYEPQEKICESFRLYNRWIRTLGIKYVNDLNKIISENKIKDFIMKNDIMMDNQVYNVAVKIKESKKKIILLGGPSSSGKTTSTKKIALYLETFGLNPIYLGLDDYFKNRNETPKDENNKYDFESLNAIDLKLFNKHLTMLLNGENVSIPSFNFFTGEKEYKNRIIKLKDNDIILIEGLHCLNEELTKEISRDIKLKIYISPFTPIGIDRHNHLSTIDIRLLRRIIRDSWSRGYTSEHTLEAWDKVREGEVKYVFPYTNEADMILNTAFIYEVGVLRVYGEPLLYSIPPESKYYNEARRMIDFMQMFFPIPSEYIENDNVLREFIGGSYFEGRY